MIKSLKLRFGSVPDGQHTQWEATPVTIFVGPNNSGKSKILSEIRHFCSTGIPDSNAKLLSNIDFESNDNESTSQLVNKFIIPSTAEDVLSHGDVFIGKSGHKFSVSLEQLTNVIKDPTTNLIIFCEWYLRYHTLILNGENRTKLITQQNVTDLQLPPNSSFHVLFNDNLIREKLRQIIFEAFGFYLTIDPTHLGTLRLRLSTRPPASEQEERGIDSAAVMFHRAATLIDFASDGVKAFCGVMIEIMAGDPEILLIDEPEAFLHPSLASKLGIEVSKAIQSSHKRIFISTHSSSFVMGCIQSRIPLTIVRLTYRSGVPTARVLPNDEILKLMRNPLLRSTGTLNGLFYEFVVVTESDTDRAFYEEINERLNRFGGNGIPNCLFLNAQNKQTVPTILKPLRKLGIPAIGIVDVDILKDGGSEWSSFLDGGCVPQPVKQSLANLRTSIKTSFDQTGRDMKREGGIELLSSTDKESANNLFDSLAQYGLFVVRQGEVESWLKNIGVSGHGPKWLIQIFERMGENPEDSNYVRPSESDVWEFLIQIKSWLENPRRKGIPD